MLVCGNATASEAVTVTPSGGGPRGRSSASSRSRFRPLPATRWRSPTLDAVGRPRARGRGRRARRGAAGACGASRCPARADWPRLALVAGGVVIGFPLFTRARAARPVRRARDRDRRRARPRRPRWWPSSAPASGRRHVLARHRRRRWPPCCAFAATQGATASRPRTCWVLVAVRCAGARLRRGRGARRARLDGWRVICWALVLSAPVLARSVALRSAAHGAARRRRTHGSASPTSRSSRRSWLLRVVPRPGARRHRADRPDRSSPSRC